MADEMRFPNDWAKFLEQYSFRDSEEIYTNGARLIPCFRVEQMIHHYLQKASEDAVEVVPCKDCKYWGDEEFAEGGYRVCECPNKDYATTAPKNHAYFPLCLENDFCSYGKRKDKVSE